MLLALAPAVATTIAMTNVIQDEKHIRGGSSNRTTKTLDIPFTQNDQWIHEGATHNQHVVLD
jgi:hypothetical protein